MKWRCEWCEKPHEENDPPCANCGHGSFERAVVPVGPEGDGNPLVWVCASCGRTHQRNNPPCTRCGHASLEKREQTFDEDDPLASVREEPRADESERAAHATGDSVTVWACTECGREHPRNNPPCSRCGHMSLEQRQQHFDDIQPSGGSWFDVLLSRYGLGLVVVVLLMGIFAAGGAGLIDVPGMATGPPTVEDVPGNESSAGHLSLADVEREYVEKLNERRTAAGYDELAWNDDLAGMATYANQRTVESTYDDDVDPPTEEELNRELSLPGACTTESRYGELLILPDRFDDRSVTSVDDEGELAEVIVWEYEDRMQLQNPESEFMSAPAGYVGVDVHVGPNGEVFVTQFVC